MPVGFYSGVLSRPVSQIVKGSKALSRCYERRRRSHSGAGSSSSSTYHRLWNPRLNLGGSSQARLSTKQAPSRDRADFHPFAGKIDQTRQPLAGFFGTSPPFLVWNDMAYKTLWP
jgi:hypothetical protein